MCVFTFSGLGKVSRQKCRNIGWATPTDHIELKQKDFKLLIRLPAVRCANSQSLPQSFAKCAISTRCESPEIFILLNRKWCVGIAYPTNLNSVQRDCYVRETFPASPQPQIYDTHPDSSYPYLTCC
jgi:hypothetical protein